MVAGIVEGCLQAGCALVGGETAEMPGMYHAGDYDLAGFTVGVVEKDRIIDGSKTRVGDVVIGLPSSGPHSNGYSLIRRLIAHTGADASTQVDGVALFDRLMAPTRIYVKPLLQLLQEFDVHGLAHVTGGGITDNLPRVIPEGLGIVLEKSALELPPVFRWLQQAAGVDDAEMYRTFNCGIGMTVHVAAGDADAVMTRLRELGEAPRLLGEIRAGDEGVHYA